MAGMFLCVTEEILVVLLRINVALCYHVNGFWTVWQVRFARVTREILFRPHCMNISLVLRNKYDLWKMAEMLHNGTKTHSIFCARKIYNRCEAVY